MKIYNFCPNCGSSLQANAWPIHCDNCDETYYVNPKPCASVLIVKDDKVLLGRRGEEPLKGAYDIIGGFMEIDELPEAAAIREAKEETGLNVRITGFLGAYVDRYGEEGDYTLNMHYIGEIVSGLEAASDDVAELEWIPISDVPLDSGFKNTREGLRDLKTLYEQGALK